MRTRTYAGQAPYDKSVIRYRPTADNLLMAPRVADIHEPTSQESLGVITLEEFEAARRDPEVIALLRRAERVLAARARRDEDR